MSEHNSSVSRLTPFQQECVDLFVHAADALSLPRSIGEIYGLLFSTQDPVSLDDVMERLQMSRGAAHEGLRWLRGVGAAKLVYKVGVRKEHFAAETSLRRLAAGFLRERIEPHLDRGEDRIRLVADVVDGNGDDADFQRTRLNQLRNWHRFAERALPAVKLLAGKY